MQKYEGEEYRHELMKLTARLGLEDNIQFVDRFLDKKELVEYLTLTDIYLTPYIGREQITSGTLAYAVGLGKAVVSTPYFYAQELLAQGRGMLAEFKDSDSIADCLIRILASPSCKQSLKGEQHSWANT